MLEYRIPGLDKDGNCFQPDQEDFIYMMKDLKYFQHEWVKDFCLTHTWWFQKSYSKYRKLIKAAPDIYTKENLERALNQIIKGLPEAYDRGYRTQYDWRDDFERTTHIKSQVFFDDNVKDAYAIAVAIQCYDNILKSPRN